MFTQCPDCGTVFRVSAAVLRTARGQVRCGVCDATFDALEYLTEDVEVDPVTGAAVATGGLPGGHGPHAVRDEARVDERDPPVEVAAELERLDPAALPPPEFPPFEETHPELVDAVRAEDDRLQDAERAEAAERTAVPAERRAGRNTPSADEDRALAEIAAQLARGARPTPLGSTGTALAGASAAAAPPPPPPSPPSPPDGEEFSFDLDMIDPAETEHVVLAAEPPRDPDDPSAGLRGAAANSALDEIPDAALEFDGPADDWDRLFVQDPSTPTIPPLDPTLARARDRAGFGNGAAADDDLEIELEELREAEDDADEADAGDGGGDDRRPSREAAPSAASAASPGEDPLARTDEFPPLRVSPEEEAAIGLGPEPPPARPSVSEAVRAELVRENDGRDVALTVRPADFDALVAAAAARAAAAVAAAVATSPPGAPVAPAAAARAPETADAGDREPPLRAPAAAEPAPAPTDPEPAWFDARRDLAPDGSRLAADPPAEWIQFDSTHFQTVAAQRGRGAWWSNALLGLGIAVLAFGLVAQAVHYFRDDLAQHAVVGPPLREAYARLGLPLEPHWNLAAYELKQWGAGADSEPGTLRVRASVVNRAARGQPYPLLRVTLEDRFGAMVARREFMPAEYLPARGAPAQLLAPNARADADLVIADPGSEAVGFELDVCLPRHGALLCGEELKLARSP